MFFFIFISWAAGGFDQAGNYAYCWVLSLWGFSKTFTYLTYPKISIKSICFFLIHFQIIITINIQVYVTKQGKYGVDKQM